MQFPGLLKLISCLYLQVRKEAATLDWIITAQDQRHSLFSNAKIGYLTLDSSFVTVRKYLLIKYSLWLVIFDLPLLYTLNVICFPLNGRSSGGLYISLNQLIVSVLCGYLIHKTVNPPGGIFNKRIKKLCFVICAKINFSRASYYV